MRSIVFITLLACGADPTTVSAHKHNQEWEHWGSGIENFGAVAPGPTDTGGSTTGFTDYDGGYFGSYTFSISASGNSCTFSNVGLIVNVANGEVTGSGQEGTTSCDLGSGTVEYTAKLSFDGTVLQDTTVSGMFYEDNIFFFEGAWDGFVVDTGTVKQMSGTFNQNIESTNPGGLVTVSGSFMAEQ